MLTFCKLSFLILPRYTYAHMEHVYKQRERKTVVDHRSYKVVHGRYHRTGGYGGVYVDLMQDHRDSHSGKQRKRDTAGDSERVLRHRHIERFRTLERKDVKPDDGESRKTEYQTVAHTDSDFLEYELRFLFAAYALVHKHAYRNGKRLRAGVSRHIEDHGLKYRDNG